MAQKENKKESVDEIIANCERLLKNCKEIDRELEHQQDDIDFLLNEWRTNKRYFRDHPGRVTTEDVIKTVYHFAWGSKNNFEAMKEREQTPIEIVVEPEDKVQAIIDKLKTVEDYSIEFGPDQDVRIFTEDEDEEEYSNLRIIRVDYEYNAGDLVWVCYAFFLDNDGDEDGFDVSTLNPKDIDTIYKAVFK